MYWHNQLRLRNRYHLEKLKYPQLVNKFPTLWSTNVHYRIHKISHQQPTLTQMNQAYVFIFFFRFVLILFSHSMNDCRRGLDWWMDLLATYTHDSELQVITASPLISIIHKSPQHSLSHFQPAVRWQLLLTMDILQLHALMASLHRLPYRTD
jgi:hypothetical protein